MASPLYDLFVAWAMLPMGGQRKWRKHVAEWLEASRGDEVLSLCCGTGATDRALLQLVQDVRITGIDLGRAQLSRARRKDRTGRIEYRLANAAETGLPTESFDRVLLVGALHEMPRPLRGRVLAEARRVAKPEGRLLVVEPCLTKTRWSAFLRSVVLFLWVPGNPEARTTRDLIEHGLATELREAGFELVRRHTTTPDWFEGILARPARLVGPQEPPR
jgi:ubiquinone/menaquinone biosynthesis C-methylase UbiE